MNKIFRGLAKTRNNFAAGEHWRDRLLLADVGAKTADAVLADIAAARKDAAAAAPKDAAPPTEKDIAAAVRRRLMRVEAMLATAHQTPFVILLLGVNGCGKTTTVGKLARRFLGEQKKVLLAAGDTFRAAAREQLQEWAGRAGAEVDIVGASEKGGDPAAVAYNAVQAGAARGADIVLIDTAGRLPAQAHLMAELGKIRRAVGKAMPGAPHELLLILDATTGQNALTQLRAFDAAAGVTGVIAAKMDGSSKGGFLLALAAECPVPVRFIGVGEGADDLAVFNADQYAAALAGVSDAAGAPDAKAETAA